MTLDILVHAQKSKLYLFPIKNNNPTPIFQGVLLLGETPKGPRPLKFRIKAGKKEDPRAPREALDLLKRADKIIIARGDPKLSTSFRQMLLAYQLSSEEIEVCRFCLLKGKFYPIKNRGISYRGEHICRECAAIELERETRYTNLGTRARERLMQMLLRTRDLDRIIAMLGQKPDPELTRFDRIEARKSGEKIKVRDLQISEKFKAVLYEKEELLPVQSLAVRAGLLQGASQLIVSATATGKTLIGELAGIENILKGRGKTLYLVPLVALANQKYEQFTERYSPLGLKIAIRVGTERIKISGRKKFRTSLASDLIIGTYEGIDYLLRAGRKGEIGNISTVIIDEVHMLEDKERGHRLDGLIARLRNLAPRAQLIYLSATLGSPAFLAQKLGARLIEYEERPVPLERHLIFAQEHEKTRIIDRLAKGEYDRKSSKGYPGQTIVFTNSRRGCSRIAKALKMPAAAYHAGLPYNQRLQIEERFAKGMLPVVVTTSALAAGVDFPASQVIFEGLAMGIEWLTVSEFHQMMGRAGRPDYHDRGMVVLLADPDKRYQGAESEDEVAFRLLDGKIESLTIEYDEAGQLEEALANVGLAENKEDLGRIDRLLLGRGDLEYLLEKLLEYGFIEPGPRPTRLGRIVASHFLTLDQAFLILDGMGEGVEPKDILARLKVFDAVFFRYADQLSTALNTEVPIRVFQGASYDLVFSGESMARIPKHLQRRILGFAREFLICRCKDSPYCGCPEKKFTEKIIELRASGLDIEDIIREITRNYDIYAYPGDLLEYLDQTARNLEAVEEIAEIYGKKDLAEKAIILREKIEG